LPSSRDEEFAMKLRQAGALQPNPDAKPLHLLALLLLALAADAAAAAILYSNPQWFASVHNLVTHPSIALYHPRALLDAALVFTLGVTIAESTGIAVAALMFLLFRAWRKIRSEN
jgi:hypothetical protein